MGSPDETTTSRMEPVESNLADYKTAGAHVEEVAIARLTEEALFELSSESLNLRSMTGLRIAGVMFVQGCIMAGYGIDWSVIGGINTFDSWHKAFDFPKTGPTIATFNALMQIGAVSAAPFLGFADVIGRRGINFIGNAMVVVAAFMQAFATGIPMFMGARFILGFGSSLMAQPQYIGEFAPTHLRGRLVGMYGACFQVGSVFMSAGLIGLAADKWQGNDWQWKIPLLCEAIFPAIVCALIYVLTPESPRYLMLRGRKEEAAKVIARYHTTEGNNVNHPLVIAVIRQMEESVADTTNKSVWDWRGFFKKGARSRVLVLVVYSIFQTWNGGGIIGQYLSPALETIGIKSEIQQQAINFGEILTYLVFTVVGSFIIDKIKRRTMIFIGLGCIIFTQTMITILSWRYLEDPTNKHISGATIFFFFLFQAMSATFIATMHNLYPVEVLSLALRAKGMGLYSLVQNASGVIQQYGISIGFQRIGYKLWTAYIAYNTIQMVLTYFVFPETSGLSLEEIDVVFETPGVRPVKMSLDIKKAQKEKARLEREQSTVGGI